jgi:cytoskeletal protein CcmA (bactofilin family)
VIKGFSSSPAPAKGAAMDTLIGRQTEIIGDVNFSGGLHVDGKIKGNVSSASDKSSSLSVSEAGVIEGNVKVSNVVINGDRKSVV